MEFHELSSFTSQDADDLNLCKICNKNLSLTSKRQTKRFNVFKTTRCCKQSCPVHIACAKKFSFIINKNYEYDNSTYENDNTMPLYCIQCATPCFFCSKRHTIGNLGVQVHVCPNCHKHWCYTHPKCKKEDMIELCEVCQEAKSNMKAATLDATSLSSPNNKDCDPMSPITTDCDPVIAKQLFDVIPNIRELKFEGEYTQTYWKFFYQIILLIFIPQTTISSHPIELLPTL